MSHATYAEMIRLREESTSSGTRMSDRDILREVIGRKQHGHIPKIGRQLPGGGVKMTLSASRASVSSLQQTVNQQQEELSTRGTEVDLMMDFFRSQPGWVEWLARDIPRSLRSPNAPQDGNAYEDEGNEV